MTQQNFNSRDSETAASLLALCLAVLIIMAGFVLPDIRQVLLALHLFPLLGAVVLLAGLNLIFPNIPLPPDKTVQIIQKEATTPEDTSRQDHQRVMGAIAGNIAHELNNMMQPVTTYSQLLQEHHKLDEKIMQEALSGILSGQQQVNKMISQLLQFSRQDDFAPAPLPFAETLKHAIEAVRPLLPASLVLQFGDLSRVRGNAMINQNQMTQLLAILMINAAKATRKSGTVAIHTRRAEDGSAELIIADNRSYAPETDHEFEIAQHILRAWRGHMAADFQHGKGLAVRITIPVIAD